MGLMMLSKEDIPLISDTLPDDLLDVQSLAEPNGKGRQPGPHPFGAIVRSVKSSRSNVRKGLS